MNISRVWGYWGKSGWIPKFDYSVAPFSHEYFKDMGVLGNIGWIPKFDCSVAPFFLMQIYINQYPSLIIIRGYLPEGSIPYFIQQKLLRSAFGTNSVKLRPFDKNKVMNF